ncbi:MAG: aspartyl protease family protein [Rhizomicrobium sp.]
MAEVPLTKDATRHVLVPAFVNGKGPFPFMLDTGADESAAYAWFAKSLNLPKGGKRELNGATGSVAMTGTLLSELRIDGARASQYRRRYNSRPSRSRADCRRIRCRHDDGKAGRSRF